MDVPSFPAPPPLVERSYSLDKNKDINRKNLTIGRPRSTSWLTSRRNSGSNGNKWNRHQVGQHRHESRSRKRSSNNIQPLTLQRRHLELSLSMRTDSHHNKCDRSR